MGLITRTISFIGTGYEDLVLCLSMCLRELNIRTLICDRSVEHIIYTYLPHVEGIDPGKEILDAGLAHYTYGKQTGEYDIVLNLNDFDGEPDTGSTVIAVTDEHRRHFEALEKSKIKNADMLIIRYFTGAVKGLYDKMNDNSAFKDVFAVAFSEQDLEAEYHMEWGKKKGFSGISDQMEEVIKMLLKISACECTEKELKKAYKKAKRGSKQ